MPSALQSQHWLQSGEHGHQKGSLIHGKNEKQGIEVKEAAEQLPLANGRALK